MGFFITEWMIGFEATARVAGRILGGLGALCAVLLLLVTILLVTAFVFDKVTDQIAKRLAKTGRTPRGKIGKIIMRSHGKETDAQV